MAPMEALLLPRQVAMAPSHQPVDMLPVATVHQGVGMVPLTVATATAIVAMAQVAMVVLTSPLGAVAMATMPRTAEVTRTALASRSPCS